MTFDAPANVLAWVVLFTASEVATIVFCLVTS